MAIVSTMSNHAKYQVMSGGVDLDSDTFRVILMNTTFAFDKDTHATLDNVGADQLSTANGYTVSGEILQSGELTEDDSNDRGRMVWTIDPSWTAAGGDIGPTGAAIIYDHSSADSTVIGCIDFGTDVTISSGNQFVIQDIAINLT